MWLAVLDLALLLREPHLLLLQLLHPDSRPRPAAHCPWQLRLHAPPVQPWAGVHAWAVLLPKLLEVPSSSFDSCWAAAAAFVDRGRLRADAAASALSLQRRMSSISEPCVGGGPRTSFGPAESHSRRPSHDAGSTRDSRVLPDRTRTRVPRWGAHPQTQGPSPSPVSPIDGGPGNQWLKNLIRTQQALRKLLRS